MIMMIIILLVILNKGIKTCEMYLAPLMINVLSQNARNIEIL